MSENRGIFSLEEFYDLQVSGETTKIFDTFRYVTITTGGPNTGYWASGYDGSPTSIVDRLDFNNDTSTAVAKGPLSRTAYNVGAIGNSSYGYIGGGGNPEVSTVDRIDYSSDTGTTPAKGPLSLARRGAKAVGYLSYGYWAGGGEPTGYSTVDRLDYSNDTAAAVAKTTLSTPARWRVGSVSNLSYGYIAGGKEPSSVSTVDRLDFSNDTATMVAKAPLSIARTYIAGAGNSSYGYFMGGTSPNVSTVDRLDYSNDTAAMVPAGPLSQTGNNANYRAGTGNSDYGYAGGGTGSSPYLSSMDRLNFSNDTSTAVTKGPLSHARYNLDAISSRANALPSPSINQGTRSEASPIGTDYGYIGGGHQGPVSTVDRIDFSNDTGTAAVKGPLSLARHGLAATGNASYGYWGGGMINPGTTYSTVDRVDFSNDTATAAVKGPLSVKRSAIGATGNQSYGYWGGGKDYSTPSPTTIVDRIDYSNDTPTAVAKGPLSVARRGLAATGNTSYGYFAGGNGPISTIDRIDFSNDTGTTPTKGPLSSARYLSGGASSRANGLPTTTSVTVDKGADGFISQSTSGNSTYPYGYVAGGDPTKSSIDRIDFGNDSATATPKGNLTQARYNYNQSVASPSHGYVMGGYGVAPEPNGNASSIDRIDFSNDTATAPTIANLNVSPGLYAAGATGSNDYAYIGGGSMHPGPYFSTIRRFDYSSDTTNTVDKSTLHANINFHTATGNLSYGYWGGYPSKTLVDRLDYSNDTAASSPKGHLVMTWRLRASVGNQSYGYFTGGQNPSNPSGYNSTNVERIDYSNDTATASSRGPMAGGRYLHATSGSGQYGYNSGGRQPTEEGSSVDRIDYANDTSTPSPRGNMSYKTKSWSGLSSQEDGKQSFTSGLIPRIRWVDSAPEVPASSVGPAFAYFGGGSPGPLSSTERLNYNNDTATASPKGPLSSAKYAAASTGSTTHGYWGSGGPAHGISTVDRIDYSNDTDAASVRGPLNQSTYMQGAMSSLTHGYWCAGTDYPSKVSRVDFSNDTVTASYVGNLDHVTYAYNVGAVGNTTHGYVIGGSNAATSKVTRIDFSNDTAVSTPVGNLPTKNTSFGTAGNANFAYTGGGEPGVYTSVVNRIDYSNDNAAALVRGPLTSVKTRVTASGNANFGYWVGGATPSVITTIDRIDYANDTVTATPKGNLGTPRRFMGTAGASAKANAYPQETVLAPVQPPFPYPEQSHNPVVNKGYGYYGGGFDPSLSPSTGRSSETQRIEYANDTATASPKGVLSSARYRLAATSSIDFGYWGGGNTSASSPNGVSTIDRLDYANDSTATVPRGPLSRIMHKFTGVGNASYGYYCGGYDWETSNSSRVDRLDFSNDTEMATQKGPLSANQQGHSAATGNQSYGYVGGGDPSRSRVDRIDYSNDTATATQKGPLTVSKYQMGATGNASYGYFAGGGYPRVSTISRIDYSNDTPTASPKGNLNAEGSNMGATGNTSYGYYGGGSYPSLPDSGRTQVTRIEFANDTATSSPKGNLFTVATAATAGASAAGNAMP